MSLFFFLFLFPLSLSTLFYKRGVSLSDFPLPVCKPRPKQIPPQTAIKPYANSSKSPLSTHTHSRRNPPPQFLDCSSVSGWWMMLRSCCFRCFGRRNGDGLMWHTDLKPHASGEFSIAVVQANSNLEDQSQVYTSPSATFVGVYDGHGGPEASRFVNRHLFLYLHSNFFGIPLFFFVLRAIYLFYFFHCCSASYVFGG